jgi:hypothetical protein
MWNLRSGVQPFIFSDFGKAVGQSIVALICWKKWLLLLEKPASNSDSKKLQ